ncbi:MAG: YdeI/OmpD-associated family protein [Gemmatimonadaceae bacterium]
MAAKPPSKAGSSAPRFFRSAPAFRSWLATNHESKTELLVGFHNRESGRDSMTWPESVAEALCVGWIDGVRRRIDHDSYSIRFTPRQQSSIWSAMNAKKMQELIDAGLVSPAGIRAFERRSAKKSAIYAYENRDSAILDPESEREFKRHRAAWSFFESCPPWYRRTAIWRIVSAKRPETRAKRLAELIACCAEGRSIPTLALSRAPRPRA